MHKNSPRGRDAVVVIEFLRWFEGIAPARSRDEPIHAKTLSVRTDEILLESLSVREWATSLGMQCLIEPKSPAALQPHLAASERDRRQPIVRHRRARRVRRHKGTGSVPMENPSEPRRARCPVLDGVAYCY
jgi:hypothetical protein